MTVSFLSISIPKQTRLSTIKKKKYFDELSDWNSMKHLLFDPMQFALQTTIIAQPCSTLVRVHSIFKSQTGQTNNLSRTPNNWHLDVAPWLTFAKYFTGKTKQLMTIMNETQFVIGFCTISTDFVATSPTVSPPLVVQLSKWTFAALLCGNPIEK